MLYQPLKENAPSRVGVGVVTVKFGESPVDDVGLTVPPFPFQETLLVVTGAETVTLLAVAEVGPPALLAVTVHCKIVPYKET